MAQSPKDFRVFKSKKFGFAIFETICRECQISKVECTGIPFYYII